MSFFQCGPSSLIVSSAPSSGPSKAICNIASRFLLPNLFPTLLLIKFCTLKACWHFVDEVGVPCLQNMIMSYRAPRLPKILIHPLWSAMKFKGWKFTFICCFVHKRREFEASMWAVYPIMAQQNIQFIDTPCKPTCPKRILIRFKILNKKSSHCHKIMHQDFDIGALITNCALETSKFNLKTIEKSLGKCNLKHPQLQLRNHKKPRRILCKKTKQFRVQGDSMTLDVEQYVGVAHNLNSHDCEST